MRRILSNTKGATYLFVMLAVVLLGITLSVAARQWKAVVQREQEADLLARGIEIQTALATYSATIRRARTGQIVEAYPLTLVELTKPPKPFLRKVYRDPLTGGDWEYLRDPAGRITGVKSKSTAEPFKQHNFPPAVRHFEGLTSYRLWVFQHPNPSTPQSPQAPLLPPVPGGTPPAGQVSPPLPAGGMPAPAVR